MKVLHVEQSLPICCSLAALGGIIEVAATAVTAVPAVREKQGIEMKWWVQWMAIAGNVGLQAVGSLMSHLIATWFGPVSLVVPFFYSATLLSNVLIFGLLGERFTKNMRVGTHVIVVAVILLPEVGPDIQEDQDISVLLRHWYAIMWFVILLLACAVAGVLLALDISKYKMNKRVAILLVARAASISVNLTVSRAFILGPNRAVMLSFIIIKLISGAIYTSAIVVQSYTVEQARFVPLNATTIIIVNALTGIIIWEDWRVISSWYGYFCIFILMGLGCDLLLSVPLLSAENPEFGTNRRASMIFKRASMATTPNSRGRLRIMTADYDGDAASNAYNDENHCSSSTTTTNTNTVTNDSESDGKSRIDAWKHLVSPMHYVKELIVDDENNERKSLTEDSEQPTPKKLWQTPQKVGNRITETTSLLAKHPKKLGGKIASNAMAIGSKGKELVERIVPGTTVHHLSRLAAWRETVSPIKKTRSRIPNIPKSQSDPHV